MDKNKCKFNNIELFNMFDVVVDRLFNNILNCLFNERFVEFLKLLKLKKSKENGTIFDNYKRKHNEEDFVIIPFIKFDFSVF